jgi:dienelactone hydrolase
MMVAMRRFFVAIALVFGLGTGIAHGGSLIEFLNISEQAKPERLLGYLARPDGPGPFPAVVVLHGCNEFFGRYVAIADDLKSEGYVALAVDSFGPRGIERCRLPFVEQGTDAYAALDHLSQQRFVDPDRIAVLGYSMGGTSALRDVERGMIAPVSKHTFQAAIAYYPWCGNTRATIVVPTMILVGALDDRTPAELCRKLAAEPREGSPPIDLTVYPGAYHSFNVRDFQPGIRRSGHWVEYNEPAATDAWAKVRAFLAVNLGSGTPDKPSAQ